MRLDTTTPSGPATLFRRIEGKPAARSDLAARIEVKYPFSTCDLGKLRRVLETNCRRIAYNREVSTVRSLYFDDAGLSACRANLDGVGSRRKVRIRWYDSDLPGRKFFLEIKWRKHRVTGKHRVALESNQCLSTLSFCDIVTHLQTAVGAEFQGDILNFTEATVLVEYKREHFISPDEGLRITLDYDILFYNQYAHGGLSSEFDVECDDLVVVEGKAPAGRESELPTLFYPLSLRAQRCSKYVLGCQKVGLIRSRA